MLLGNALGQLFLLNYLLGAEYLGVHFFKYGFDIIQQLIDGKDVVNTQIFPRVTMCDFTIRQFSNLQDYTIECSLPINLFSEKFFIFIWFWIFVLLTTNVMSLIMWLWTIFSISHVNYVKKYIKLVERVRGNEVASHHMHISCFAEEYLRHDGIFYLRMLSSNTNDVMVAQVIDCLWTHYKTNHCDSERYHKPHNNKDYDCENGSLRTRARPEYQRSNNTTYKRAASKTPAKL